MTRQRRIAVSAVVVAASIYAGMVAWVTAVPGDPLGRMRIVTPPLAGVLAWWSGLRWRSLAVFVAMVPVALVSLALAFVLLLLLYGGNT